MKISTGILIGLFLILSACSKSDDNELIESSCMAASQITTDQDFISIDSTVYSITNIRVLENCLEIIPNGL
jgi:hypothetical protein